MDHDRKSGVDHERKPGLDYKSDLDHKRKSDPDHEPKSSLDYKREVDCEHKSSPDCKTRIRTTTTSLVWTTNGNLFRLQTESGLDYETEIRSGPQTRV
jgi:hypothetical protein